MLLLAFYFPPDERGPLEVIVESTESQEKERKKRRKKASAFFASSKNQRGGYTESARRSFAFSFPSLSLSLSPFPSSLLPPSLKPPAPNRAAAEAATATTTLAANSSATSSSLLRKDPRPLSDKAYQQQLAAAVRSCLLRHGYTATPLSAKTLSSPTTKEFSAIALFLFRLVDPTTPSFRKLEDDVALGFRRLRYPVAFSKCALFSVGSSATWPGLLGALAWLADLVEYIDRAVRVVFFVFFFLGGGGEGKGKRVET